MTILLDLSGRVALVTGGARGVGLGITQRLLDAGAEVVTCGRNAPDSLPAAEDGRDASFVAADVRDPDAVDALVAGIVERLGRLDIAVNNAGGSPATETATASPRFSEKIIGLNLTAALHVATRANAQMQQQDGGGVIVNIGSLSGMRPTPNTAAYGAAKAGLLSLTGTLAMEWAPKVRVNSVSPGIVRTEVFEEYYGGPAGAAAVAATIPMGRVAEPSDIGNAVAFLASPLAASISGANLTVHGGGERLAFSEHLGLMAALVPPTSLDRRIMRLLVRHRHVHLTQVARAAEAFGYPDIIAVLGLLVAGLLVAMRRWSTILALGSAAVTALAASQVLKEVFRRHRPPFDMALTHPGGYSFPSSATSLTVAVVLVLVLDLCWPSPKLRWPGTAIGAALIVVSGWAVMYLGAHWFTDVIAGWFLGALIAVGCSTMAPIVIDTVTGWFTPQAGKAPGGWPGSPTEPIPPTP